MDEREEIEYWKKLYQEAAEQLAWQKVAYCNLEIFMDNFQKKMEE